MLIQKKKTCSCNLDHHFSLIHIIMHQSMPMIYIYKWDSRDTLIEQSDIEQFDSRIVEIIRRDRYYLRRITHLNNFVHSTVVQCSLHHVSSHEQTVSSVLCNCAETVFFVRHTRSFFSFFFSLSFFYFIFFPLCDECLWADRETQSRCLRKIFFFWSESTRFLKRINRRLNRCSRLGADERTIVWSRIGDGVLFDSFILDRAPRVIRFFWEVSAREEFMGDSFFFPLRLIFENNLTAGILVIFQYFDTKIPRNKIDPIIDYSFSLFHKELHNVIESKSHDNTLYRCCLKVKDGEL